MSSSFSYTFSLFTVYAGKFCRATAGLPLKKSEPLTSNELTKRPFTIIWLPLSCTPGRRRISSSSMEPLDNWKASALYTMVSPCITIFTFVAVTVTPSSCTSFILCIRLSFMVGITKYASRFPISTVIFCEYSSYPSAIILSVNDLYLRAMKDTKFMGCMPVLPGFSKVLHFPMTLFCSSYNSTAAFPITSFEKTSHTSAETIMFSLRLGNPPAKALQANRSKRKQIKIDLFITV